MANKFQYEDILHLAPHISKKYPQATMEDRAARFSPFAAITGYEDMVNEEARVTQERMELDESTKRELDEKLSRVMRIPNEKRKVTLTYFQPDQKKSGGAYVSITGIVKRIDEYQHALLLRDGSVIPIGDIRDVEIISDDLSGKFDNISPIG